VHKLKILHILGTAEYEGVSVVRIVTALAKGLDQSRYRMEACFLRGHGPLIDELEAAGVTAFSIDWPGGARNPAGAWRFLRRLRGRSGCAVVHQHYGGRSVTALARLVTGAAIIRHIHGRVLESEGSVLNDQHYSDADAVIGVSSAVVRNVRHPCVRIIHSGVSLPEPFATSERGGEARPFVVGVAGRLVPVKGFVEAIRALALVQSRFPGARLEIAGDGPSRSELEDEARALGIAHSVTFLGWQTSLEPWLSRWDAVLQPSLDEGLPLALLEAMAAGKPVIASRVGGMTEVIKDGMSGWLIPPGDPTALSERLICLILRPDLRSSFGAAGRARVAERFSIATMVHRTRELYEQLSLKG
jgi:glycosyltransferase involved in cell wall biosynthesis